MKFSNGFKLDAEAAKVFTKALKEWKCPNKELDAEASNALVNALKENTTLKQQIL